MKKTTVRLGTLAEFFERGRSHAKRADAGTRLRESSLITFENPADMMRFLTPAKMTLFRAIKLRPGSISAIAARVKRDRSAVTRDVAELQRFGLVLVAAEVLPGHGRMKKVSAAASEIRLEAVLS